jgi:hypothetical protein
MFLTTYSASLATPRINADDTADRKTRPTKYSPGSLATTRACPSAPSSPRRRRGGRSMRSRDRSPCIRSRSPLRGPVGPPAREARPAPQRSWDAFDPGGGDVLGLDPDERHAVGNELRASLAADRRVCGQHSVEQEPQHPGMRSRAATSGPAQCSPVAPLDGLPRNVHAAKADDPASGLWIPCP